MVRLPLAATQVAEEVLAEVLTLSPNASTSASKRDCTADGATSPQPVLTKEKHVGNGKRSVETKSGHCDSGITVPR